MTWQISHFWVMSTESGTNFGRHSQESDPSLTITTSVTNIFV